MPKLPAISLISSFSQDRLLNSNQQVTATTPGGPALFISQALKKQNVPFKLFAGDQIKVDMLITPNGEFGKVSNLPPSKVCRPAMLKPWTILSTVLDEWVMPDDVKLPPFLFMDIQGFVRDGTNFGNKKRWETPIKAYCLKGTKEEISYLPPKAITDQKKRILIVSDGTNGVDLYCKGMQRNFDVTTPINSKDTIGAGDTLLANFVACLYKGINHSIAIEMAMHLTSQFLASKAYKLKRSDTIYLKGILNGTTNPTL